MQYPLTVPGFENRQLVIQAGGLFSTAKLMIDGEPAPRVPSAASFYYAAWMARM
jgi:hypothetical protein